MKNTNKIQKNTGAAMMIVVIFFMFISLVILTGIVSPVVNEFKIASDNFQSKKAYFIAESGVEDVIYRLKNNLNVGASESLTIDGSTTLTSVTDVTNSQKEIVSLGETNSVNRKVSVKVNTGDGVSFSYGVQVGVGGFVMDNNSQIIGSVYSNGNITGSGLITGSATAANSPALEANQTNGTGIPTLDLSFGQANSTQDFAQSFQVSQTGPINKIQVYLKKVGAPSNITVRIATDSSGSPGSTLAVATLSASTVSTNYGWIDVPLDSHPQLSSSQTYWLILDTTTSTTKYYKIGTLSATYASGLGKIGQYGTSWSPTSPANLDGFFQIYLGGLTGLIYGVIVGTGTIGNAYAHTVTNTTIRGTNYCQIGSGNNKVCNTSLVDPVQVAMPISEQNILDWKDAAALGGTISGDYTLVSNTTLGPKKITGNLTVTNGKILTMAGTLWVEGNLLVDNNAIMKLATGYGASEGIIIVDGTITISNNSTFQGSGTTGSYMMALSTSSSSSAINLSNNGGAVTLYAANGTINVANNGTAKSLTGYYIHLSNNAVITYDEGLRNANFVSGPSGSWNVGSWQEIE